MWSRHPQVAWILWQQVPGGFQVADERTGQVVFVRSPAEVHAFAAERSSERGYYGAGDAVAAVAKPIARAFGMDPGCAPCAQRQAALNRFAPRLWRR